MLVFYTLLIATNIFLSIIPLYTQPKKAANISFSAIVLCLSAWTFSCYGLWNFEDFLFWGRMTFFGPSFLPLALLVFASSYPVKVASVKRSYLVVLSIVAIVFAALTPTDFIISDMRSVTEVDFNFGFHLYVLYLVGVFVWAGFIMGRGLKTYQSDQKIQLRFVAYGLGLTLSLAVFCNLILPLFGIIHFTDIGPLSVTFLVVLTLYGMLKYEVLETKMVVNIFVSSSIVAFLIVASFLVLFGLDFAPSARYVLITLVALGWAFAAYPLRQRLITTGSQKFIKGWYDPAAVLASLSELIQDEKNKNQLFNKVQNVLLEELDIGRSIVIRGVQDDEGRIQSYEILHFDEDIQRSLAPNNPLFQHFKKIRKPCEAKELPKECQLDLSDLGFSNPSTTFLLPCFSPDNLDAVLVFGNRVSTVNYSKSDFLLFQQVVRQIAAALYRMTPLEKIEKGYFEVQQKLLDTQMMRMQAQKIENLAYTIQEYNHEIKTPLAVIQGEIELFDPADDNWTTVKKGCLAQIERIIDIVHTTLQISSIKDKNREDSLEALDLNAIIRKTLDIFPMHNIEVKCELAELAKIRGSEAELQMVFTNLLKNAAEATEGVRDAEVVIQSALENNMVVISVSDNGPGIDPKMKDKIWEPFASSKVTKGRGLGLSSVWAIVHDHDATIRASNKKSGGAEFVLKFPSLDL